MTKVYNRELKKIVEVKHFGGSILNKIYRNKLLTMLLTSRFVSICYGVYDKSFLSRKKIKKFIEDNSIDMSIYEEKKYSNFNDFFIRKLKNINIDNNKKHLVSPVQGYLKVYPIKDDLSFSVKNLNYTLDDLFKGEDLSLYKNGMVLVFRLALNNYHRFHYIDDGKLVKRTKINGRLHTVSDSSSKYKIFKENYREYSILDTSNFGKIIYMEVGALLVGKIINHNYEDFKRGMEKGYFLPGGSTIILVLNNIKVDDDIMKQSINNIETIVDVGERIGELND